MSFVFNIKNAKEGFIMPLPVKENHRKGKVSYITLSS